jgi:nitrogen fixation-related uncharacterized protein
MDLEVSSLITLVSVDLVIFTGIMIYLVFFYKWDNKQYDDMADNLEYRRNPYGNDLFINEGASESLIAKDEISV